MTQQSTRRGRFIAPKTQPQLTSQPPRRIVFSIKRLLIHAVAGLGAGLTASMAAVVLMGILRLAAGIPTPVELFGDFVLKHISVDTFIRLLISFGANAKTAPL